MSVFYDVFKRGLWLRNTVFKSIWRSIEQVVSVLVGDGLERLLGDDGEYLIGDY